MRCYHNTVLKCILFLYHSPLRTVTEPKLVLLATGQANKSGYELLEQGITILIGKLADGEDGRLASQKTIFPQSEFWPRLYTRGGEAHCGTDQWLSRTTESGWLTVAH